MLLARLMRVIGALLDRVVDAVGLHRGVVEVEAADVEHRDLAVVRVRRLQRVEIAVEVDVAAAEVERTAALELADGVDAPAADERVEHAAGVAAPLSGRWPNGSS